jgi:hypothetical protein
MAAAGLLRRLAEVWAPLWQVEGELPLPPGMAPATALGRLAELLHAPGTSHDVTGDTLAFTKRDPAAQDKLATFNAGRFMVLPGDGGPVLRYHLASRALLFCFMLPLLFLGLGEASVYLEKPEEPPAKTEKAGKAEKAEKAEKAKKKDEVRQLHWIDKAMGAPAPEAKDKKKKPEKPKKPTPYTGYTFAGIALALYLIGRVLEAWLARRLFTRQLWGETAPPGLDAVTHPPS